MNLVEPAPNRVAHAHCNFALGQEMEWARFAVITNAVQGRNAATQAADIALSQDRAARKKFAINPVAPTIVQQDRSVVTRRVEFAPILDRANAQQVEVVSLERPAVMDFASMDRNVAHRRARPVLTLERRVNLRCAKLVAKRVVHWAKFAAILLVRRVLRLGLPAL